MAAWVRDVCFKSVRSPRDMGPTCVLKDFGTYPVHGRLVHNVPITFGTRTFLHMVCEVPVWGHLTEVER